MAERYYVGKAHWLSILHAWLETYTILAAQAEGDNLYYAPLIPTELSHIVYDRARSVQPLKTYLIPPLDEVSSDYKPPQKPWMFLGVKACDLAALSILDPAFGGEFTDPFYAQRRHGSLIVSSDCTAPLSSCFCTRVGGQPYAIKGFDLNLSRIWDGFVVEVGSLKGRQLLDGHDEALKELVKEEAETLLKIRDEARQKVNRINSDFVFPEAVYEVLAGQRESAVWADYVKTCVECGACNHACSTCHCYYLDDVTRADFVKLRGWDGCQYSGYAVTAGGGTPRPELKERFRNRYYCKFKYLPDNYSQKGCTGCGRCIDACQGQIDMRRVLHDLSVKSGEVT